MHLLATKYDLFLTIQNKNIRCKIFSKCAASDKTAKKCPKIYGPVFHKVFFSLLPQPPLSANHLCEPYGNTGCGVFKEGIQNQKGFWLKINISKGNFLKAIRLVFNAKMRCHTGKLIKLAEIIPNFDNWSNGELSKIDVIKKCQ